MAPDIFLELTYFTSHCGLKISPSPRNNSKLSALWLSGSAGLHHLSFSIALTLSFLCPCVISLTQTSWLALERLPFPTLQISTISQWKSTLPPAYRQYSKPTFAQARHFLCAPPGCLWALDHILSPAVSSGPSLFPLSHLPSPSLHFHVPAGAFLSMLHIFKPFHF